MTKHKLSKRLHKVAFFIKEGASVADIGSDHAYLPVYLIKENIAKYAVAGEVNEGPFLSAQKQVRMNLLEEAIHVKLGNGLAVLEGEKVDTVVVAGMGGPLIRTILEEGKAHLTNVERLVLQPNIAADHIRKWLIDNKWLLIDEALVEEDGHIYEVLVAERGNPLFAYSEDREKEIWLGPILLKYKNSTFNEKWNRELEQLEKIYEIMQSASSDSKEVANKLDEVKKKIHWLKEELT
ncbi:tRNA (adenine(22)-N(1))-methyltransferase TrmK [Bacillus shivajii]|uniref:tRNA (adenine(22)-N(1))-methyltransferase n=1 Tax=Bacillus shivajii TaxID=1983719 RepID=UPI001CF9834C|nr:tRNA (adenine(22)-N(1))-methyltransferase TrmK [Bacillus shivajii]UCZ54518.1 tRNA (adenine(22)-N(1))-methyltransferase TrmK [Bacillus shivajii]